MSSSVLSKTAISNLYTMGVAVKRDARQAVPEQPSVPPLDVRILRAKLLMEETLETIQAMGLEVFARTKASPLDIEIVDFVPNNDLPVDLDTIIDGCCDTIYVAVGALCSCGVLDSAHMLEVCYANNSKFPNGQAIISEHGKYLKPEGWKPPNHAEVRARQKVNLLEFQKSQTFGPLWMQREEE